MSAEFDMHILNDQGIEKAKAIAFVFENLLFNLEGSDVDAGLLPEGRYLSIVKTKLEEACFFAKKGMACDPLNQK